ncbi:CRAL-TRIO domain-containing protein [Thamnocephalis sphaerospora]|uniref:CRAL-TRIO domain-containing protein n=1 Tax=Thamnocephalis sphaerospora TaxID=78915 RepID=A0A4P9XX99_9FUNG|nr:CRAL-TRIO domain-containing protein [Thamnocephalis sphaerospora]|eukprot:RKP10642.1 CRAL-TRIO domain-containing protein [Thamnocephalis sphaerospora]
MLRLPSEFKPEALPATLPCAQPLDAEQQDKLAALRVQAETLAAAHPDDAAWLTDACLLRYLRAARWQVAKAAERLGNTLAWRRERRPHVLDPDYVMPEAATGKIFVNGFDRYGRPVIYLVPRRENTKPSRRQMDHLIFFLERAIAAMPPGVEQVTLIIDFTGASLFNSPGAGVAKETANMLEQHYPERLGSAYIVGAPWFFGQVFKLVSPFLDTVTRDKINFVDLKHKPEEPKSTKEAGVEQNGEWTPAGVPSPMWDIIPPEMLDATIGGRYVFRHEMPTYWEHLLAETVHYSPELPPGVSATDVANGTVNGVRTEMN